MPMQRRERYHALIVRSVAKSAYPPRLSVNADMLVGRPSAITGREHMQQDMSRRQDLLDHLVGAGEQRGRHGEAERLGSG